MEAGGGRRRYRLRVYCTTDQTVQATQPFLHVTWLSRGGPPGWGGVVPTCVGGLAVAWAVCPGHTCRGGFGLHTAVLGPDLTLM